MIRRAACGEQPAGRVLPLAACRSPQAVSLATNIKQIEFLARAIVNRLEDRGLVEFGDAEIGIQVVTRTLEENFQSYDTIEQEARTRLAKSIGEREPSEQELSDEMQRVAAERNFVL